MTENKDVRIFSDCFEGGVQKILYFLRNHDRHDPYFVDSVSAPTELVEIFKLKMDSMNFYRRKTLIQENYFCGFKIVENVTSNEFFINFKPGNFLNIKSLIEEN